MIKYHLLLAFRNLIKRKGYSILNIAGLAIGMTCCLLILQYVSYEKSYDKFPANEKQIVRLRLDLYEQGKLAWQSAVVYPAIAPTMKKDYPEVEDFCRLLRYNVVLANTNTNIKFKETQGYFADPSSIKMLGVQMVSGDPDKALNEPDNIILSETMAKKYFGNAEAVGKRLQIRDSRNRSYQITAVFKDHPHNSHLRINYLASYATLVSDLKESGDTTNRAETSFGWYDFYTYLQLKPGTQLKGFESKLPAFCERYMNSNERNKANKRTYTLSIIPLSDIHLYSNYKFEAGVNGNGKAVSFIFLIGFIIMAIGWVNYINLSTARSVERGREVGVRKVLGAGKFQLVRQFLVESLLINLVAVLMALAAFNILSPTFNALMGREDTDLVRMSNASWLLFVILFVTGTLLSGLYPAFVMSGYKPVSVLKGAIKNTSRGILLRKGLIIGQFGISVILIAGTIIVYRQVNFMRHQSLGFNMDQTLVLDGASTLTDSVYLDTYNPFKEELLKQTGIQSVTASTNVPGQEIFWTTGVKKNAPNSESVTLHHLGIDYDFIPQFQLKMIEGRNFSKDFTADKNTAILNETAVSAFGFKDPHEAVGQKLLRRRDTLTVIGVVQSFHHRGLQKAIDPQILLLVPDSRDAYSVKLSTADMPKAVATIQNIWDKHFPGDPFNYFFLDDFYNQQYRADQKFGKVFSLFAMLAILIACLGLLGLSSYTILQRTKEIGVRKVLGASTQHVVYILAKDFLILVMGAFVIAVPFTWWIMHNWLQEFAYRINIGWGIFLFAGTISIGIALLTVSFQAIKAAIANPIKSLRTE